MQTVVIKIVLFASFIACLSNHSIVDKRNNKSQSLLHNVQVKKIVRLSPNPSFDGKVVVESFIPDTLSFYLFDARANLVRQFLIKGNSSFTIVSLEKGIYMYDVFQNEESIENGNIQVK
ncbi:MAG: T9SS type A sorting domain-containing protein [Chitinophagaceae bacterium]